MKRTVKQITAMLLVISMCISLLPMAVFASDTEDTEPSVLEQLIEETEAAEENEEAPADPSEDPSEIPEETEEVSTPVEETMDPSESEENPAEEAPAEEDLTEPEEAAEDDVAAALKAFHDQNAPIPENAEYVVLVLDGTAEASEPIEAQLRNAVADAENPQYIAVIDLNTAAVLGTFGASAETAGVPESEIEVPYSLSLTKAAALLQGISSEKKSIVVYTSALPTSEEASGAGGIAAQIRESGIEIYALGLFAPEAVAAGDVFLQSLAGDRCYLISEELTAEDAVSGIAAEITRTFVSEGDLIPEDYNNQDVLDALAAMSNEYEPFASSTKKLVRYTALVLDTSGSMSGTPISVQRQAAIKFCESVLKAKGTNYVAIVKLNTNSTVACTFTDDLQTLKNHINSTSANGGTNINEALQKARELLDGIPKKSNQQLIRNLVLCSDGLPEHGDSNTNGHYTSADSSNYARANVCYDTASAIKKSGLTIYTLGFFHGLSGNNLAFGKRFMKDLASEGCSHIVTNVDELEFIFGEIASDVSVTPYDFKFLGSLVNKNVTQTCYYSDAYFLKKATEYDDHLATMSLCLELSSWTANENWTSFVASTRSANQNKPWSNAYNLLDDLGYGNIAVTSTWGQKPKKDTIAAVFATKQNDYDNSTMVAVAVRGGGYGQEWASNFTVGKSGEHEGFATAKRDILNELDKYLNTHNITGDIKLWIVGFSRGGAVANMVGGELTKNGSYFGYVNIAPEDLFVYTFEAPQGTTKKLASSGNYDNIHNSINLNDLVPLVAPTIWGFARYNTDQYLPSSTKNAAYRSMRTFFETFEGDTGEYVKDYGKEYELQINWSKFLPGGDPFVEIIEKEVATNRILLETSNFLFNGLFGDRNTYYIDFQDAVRELTAILKGATLGELLGEEITPEMFLERFFEQLTVERIWDIVSPMLNIFKSKEARKAEVKENLIDFVKEILNRSDLFGTVIFIADLKNIMTDLLWRVFDTCLDDLADKNTKSLQSVVNTIYMAVGGGIAQAHRPELALSWMMSQDSYYKAGQTDFSYPVYRMIHINCPVNVAVYNSATKQLVATITHGQPVNTESNAVLAYVNTDGEKIVLLPADESYSVAITAVDNGTVSYTVTECDEATRTNTRIVSFETVTVNKGDTLNGSVPAMSDAETRCATPNGSSVAYTLIGKNGNIPAVRELRGDNAEYTRYNISVASANEYGSASGGGDYAVGEYAKVTASPMAGSNFLGWYENNTLVSKDIEYRFAPSRDTKLVARFSAVKSYTMNVQVIGDGTVVNKPITLPAGTEIQLCAIPNADAKFVCWYAAKGEFDDDTDSTAWFTMPASDVTVYAQFTAPSNPIEIEQEYLSLAEKDQVTLSVIYHTQIPSSNLKWTVEDTDSTSVISVDAKGTVTALKEGTAFAIASVTIGDTVYSDRCRIDVVAAKNSQHPIASEVKLSGSVSLPETKATVELYHTDYTRFPVVLNLRQNMSAYAAEEKEDNGAAIEKASFASSEAAELFTLHVTDDRHLEIIPTDAALNNPARVKASYKTTIEMIIDGTRFVTPEMTLTVKKSLPKIKAAAVKINSNGTRTAQLTFTGGNVTEVRPDGVLPANFELDGLNVVYTGTANKASSKLKLWAKVDGITEERPVTVSVSVTRVDPTVSLTFTSKPPYASEEVTILEPEAVQTVKSVGYTLNARSGSFGATTLADNFIIIPPTNPTTPSAPTKAPGKKASSATLLPKSHDKIYLRTTVSPAQFADSDVQMCLTDSKGKEVSNVFVAKTYRDGIITLAATDKTPYGETYKLTVNAVGSAKKTTFTLNTVAEKTKPALSLKASGSIDMAIADSPIAIKMTISNYHISNGEDIVISVLQSGGKPAVSKDVTKLFKAVRTDDTLILTAAAALEKGYTYTANVGADLNNDGIVDCEKSVKLNTKWSDPSKVPVSVALKVSGSIDAIRPGTFLTVTPTFKNYFGYEPKAEDLVFYDGKTPIPGNAPFDVQVVDGIYVITNNSADSSVKYSVGFAAEIDGTLITSKPVSISVKMGTAKMTQSTKAITLLKKDRYDSAIVHLAPADGALSRIARVEQDSTSAAQYTVVDLGNGDFAITFRDFRPASKAATVKLNVYLVGNQTSKPNASVSVKVTLK